MILALALTIAPRTEQSSAGPAPSSLPAYSSDAVTDGALMALATELIGASDGIGADLSAFRRHMAGCGDTLSLTFISQWLESAHTPLPVALAAAVAGDERARQDLRARYTGRGADGGTTVNERALAHRLNLAAGMRATHGNEAITRAFTATHTWTQAGLARQGTGETVRLYRGLEGEAARSLVEAVAQARQEGDSEVQAPVSFLSSWSSDKSTAALFAGVMKSNERRGVIITSDVPRERVLAASAAHPMLSRSAEDEWIVMAPESALRLVRTRSTSLLRHPTLSLKLPRVATRNESG